MDLAQVLLSAVAHHQAGRLEVAEAIYRRVLQAFPDQPNALHYLGLIAYQRQQHHEAIDLIGRSLAQGGGSADTYANLAAAQRAAGLVSESVASFRKSLALHPGHAETHKHLAETLRVLSEFDEAIFHALRAAELAPSAATFTVLADIRAARGELEAAIKVYQLALNHDPRCAEALNGMGITLQFQRKPKEALVYYRRAVQANPSLPSPLTNLGLLLVQQHQYKEAMVVLARAVELSPSSVTALNGLGAAMRFVGNTDGAALCCERACTLNPDFVEAMTNLAVIRLEQGRAADAVTGCEQAIALRPHYVHAHSSLLFSRIFLPGDDGTALAAEQKRWGQVHADYLTAEAAPHENDRSPDRRLRVGYVSPYFREHCQTLFTIPLLSSHDHQQFEIFCYSDVADDTPETHRLRACADVWRDVQSLSDEDLAALIRQDRIDVLVDLTMHMAENRALVFARKPAPVQVCWLAYPGSTGMAAMDYRISDQYLDPPGMNDHLYTEKTIRLPDAFWCYDPLEDRTTVSDPPSILSAQITFGSLNNFCKVNPEVLKLWARVLREVPHSRMMILCGEGSHRQETTRLLGEEGIEPVRIRFVKHIPREQYLLYYREIDIVLDTFPSNGHTTSLDMFWMGVPVVTMVGPTVTGRAGLCQATLLGLSELIAYDADQYVGIAKTLARDPLRLTELRKTLRGRLNTSPLMDAPRFARNMESAYRTMWHRWREKPNNPADLVAGRLRDSLPAEFYSVPSPDQVPVRIINSAIAPRLWNDSLDQPLVTCIMLTSNRPSMARRSIECFLRQTYPNRELLILCDGEQTELAAHVASLNSPSIRLIHQTQSNKTLGERRNDGVALARGEWVCIWDDDDLYDAARLSVQMSALRRSGAVAGFLDRLILWWPGRKRLAISERRNWEGSMLALKSAMPRFAPLSRAEDTPVMQRLLASARVVNIDIPRLYTYVLHGANTTPPAQFEYRWSTATDRFVGRDYQIVLRELRRGLGLPIEDRLE